MTTKQRLCVIIPAFNEEKVIAEVVRGVKNEFSSAPYETEVVLVDDLSTDQTGREARNAGAVVIRHLLNTGAGGATATGLTYASQKGFDLAATMDADGQHLSTDVAKGVEELVKQQADLLIGSRLINSQGMSKTKVLGNKGLSAITNLLFGINVTDSQSGLRIFSRRAIEQLRWKANGFEFCSEMLWRAKQQNLKISEFPIEAVYTDYSKAKGQNNWNAINILKGLIYRRFIEAFE